jgi:hypothetical protein
MQNFHPVYLYDTKKNVPYINWRRKNATYPLLPILTSLPTNFLNASLGSHQRQHYPQSRRKQKQMVAEGGGGVHFNGTFSEYHNTEASLKRT